jgi:ribonuclease HI
LRRFVEAGHAEPTTEQPKGWVRIRTRAETDKNRRRCLGHTVTVNEIPRVGECPLPTPADVQALVWDNEWGIACDFSQWFSQFELSPLVRNYYMFHHGGQLYRLTRLQMGGTQSCDLAQVVSEIVAAAAVEGTQAGSRSYIDNLAFGGSYKDMCRTAAQLLRVCQMANITVNDAHTIVPTQQLEYIGMVLDFRHKTCELSSKMQSKLQYVEKKLDTEQPHTRRQIAAVFGLLAHVHLICRAHQVHIPARHWMALKFGSHVAREGQADPAQWDRTVDTPPHIRKSMMAWAKEARELGPFKLLRPWAEYTKKYTLECDASGAGWGAVLYDPFMNVAMTVKDSWEKSTTFNAHSSVSSEPEAIVRALQAAQRHIPDNAAVEIVTDHQGLRDAYQKGFGHAREYNGCIATVGNVASAHGWRIAFKWISGTDNAKADQLSRTTR